MKQATLRAVWVLLCSTLALAAPALADSFEVNPISVSIARNGQSADVSIINRSDKELRFSLNGGAWTQSSDNPLQVTPSDDLLIFPEMFRLAPGATQRVRVSLLAAPAPDESAYRLYVAEMPPVARPQNGHTALNVVTRIGIPIFKDGTDALTAKAEIAQTFASGNRVVATLRNAGNVHLAPSSVHLSVRSGNRLIWSQDEPVWYVLADSQSVVSTNLPKGICAFGRSVDVTWHLPAASINASASCR